MIVMAPRYILKKIVNIRFTKSCPCREFYYSPESSDTRFLQVYGSANGDGLVLP